MAKTLQKAPGGLGRRLRYEFDKSMAAGPIALIGWLAVLSLIVIVIAGGVLALFRIAQDGSDTMSFGEAVWESLMRTLDSGTMGGDTGWAFRWVMLMVTLGGIFIVSALIGVLSTGLEGKLDELRKGRSDVIEKDHTIILNWSPSVFDIIAELTIANQSRRRPRIVIMADKDKVEMEDEIAQKVPNLKNTRVICRSGDPTDLTDLGITSPQTSRSIIVLSPDAADPDSAVIKSVLALVNDPRRRKARYQIAAEIRAGKSAELARVVGGDEVQLVLADELIARIMVHSSRQSGLSAVYSELLDFDGCEIYTIEQKPIEGTSFGDALMAYDTSTLIGLTDPTGKVFLNPPMETQIAPGMKAILIAEDDTTIKVAANPLNVDHTAIALYRKQERTSERTLMLGWNRRGPMIAFELSRYVAPGSVLTIAADTPELQQEVGALMISGSNLQVEYGIVDTANRAALDSLNIPSYDHVLVLGYSDHMDAQATDTRTLVTLLQLRKIAEAAGSRINVVSEMIDVRNRELAEVTRADDFVVSNKLVSLMLAQASENENIGAIFADLLDEQGSEIYMRPADAYLELAHPMSFYTVTEACRQRGEVALGYVKKAAASADDPRNMGGVVVNPKKSDTITLEDGDRIIVLARD
jgi:voltage-gated potassium channel Kch